MLPSETFRIPAASINDTHVRSSIAMIVDAATLAGSGDAAVLGCGKCTEIPVRYLSEIFKRVDLVDLDSDALKSIETQCWQWEEAKNSCVLHHSDLTGLIPEIESNARDIAAKASGPLPCLDRLGELLALATPSFWRSRNNEKYNLLICSAVLTQLQATVRNRIENIFLDRYGGHAFLLSSHEKWRRHIWNFARQLEDGFVTHLKTLTVPEAIIYISDTVRVCFVKFISEDLFSTEGSWIVLGTNRLTDYFDSSYKIIREASWSWFLPKIENNSDGRLYEVQALVLRLIRK